MNDVAVGDAIRIGGALSGRCGNGCCCPRAGPDCLLGRRVSCGRGENEGGCQREDELDEVLLVFVLLRKEFEVDGFAHGFIAVVAGVEVVAGVVEREKHAGVRGVGGEFVEVDNAVELVGGANPFVDGLTHLFACRTLILCADEWRKGSADDLDAMSVGAGCELAEADDEIFCGDDVVGFGGVGGVADVVDAFHDDEVLDAGLGEDVAVESGQCGGTGGVVEDAVAADTLVQNAEIRGLLVGQEAPSENVRPAGVGVAGAVGPVGDAVAEGDDGSAFVVGGDVDSLEEVPGEEGGGSVERGGADDVAGNEVVGLIGEGMEGQLIDQLVGEKDADCEIGGGSDFEGHWVADDQGAWRDDDCGCSAEGEWCGAACGNGAGPGAEGYLCSTDGQRIKPEFVGEDYADRRAADGDMDDLAKGGAVGAWSAKFGSRIFGGHGRCGPGADPVVRGRCGGSDG
jgi:hypothetical protein